MLFGVRFLFLYLGVVGGRLRGIHRLRGVVGGGLGSISLGLRVVGSSLVGHISNKPSLMGGSVAGGLHSAIGKSDGEGASNITVLILGLLLVEVSGGVVISYAVLVGESLRGSIIGVRLGSIGGGSSCNSHNSGGKDNLEILSVRLI